jgi:hypothetical protein
MAAVIDHPLYYNQLGNIECIDVIQHFDFCVGSAMKYLWRAGLKEGAADIDDYKKALWYIQRKIELCENSQTETGLAQPPTGSGSTVVSTEKQYTYGGDLNNLLDDGYAYYSKRCLKCGANTMYVVRPGIVRCSVCDI